MTTDHLTDPIPHADTAATRKDLTWHCASPSSAPATSAPSTPPAWPSSATTSSASTSTTDKVATLNEGRAPFFEPGLEPLLAEHVGSGRLRFTTSFEEAAEFGDVHFVCVGTPQQPGGRGADLRYVDAAVDALAPHLRRPGASSSESRPSLSAPPTGSPTASRRRRPPWRRSTSRGTRSSSARGSPSRTPCVPTGWCSA